MVVLVENVQIRLSGGASNSNPFASLGGVKSSNQMRDDMIDALFDPISETQRGTGHTDYYCIYVHNNSGTSQMSNTKIWFTVVPSYITMGLGTSPVGGTEQTIATDTTPPAGINFSQPLSELNSLSIGIIPLGSHKAVWFRRIIPVGVMPTANILTRFKVEGDNA
jgi:hypothetical protein